MAFLWLSLSLLVVAVQAERLYTQPPIRQHPAVTPAPYRPSHTTPSPALRHGTGQFLPQNLTFVVSLRNLKANSVDPQVKVSKAGSNSVFELLGKTEPLDNTANPDYLHVFWIIWNKGTQQKLKFEVRDVDNFRRDDPLGHATFNLDDYVLAGEKLNVTLQNGTGSILVQKVTPQKFRLYARNLPSADTIGKSDPYVESYWSKGSNGQLIKFATSATINDNENPDWNETFEFANYIKGTDQYWTFKVYDSDTAGSDDLGEATIELDPWVLKRATKIVTLAKKGSKSSTATLAITPA